MKKLHAIALSLGGYFAGAIPTTAMLYVPPGDPNRLEHGLAALALNYFLALAMSALATFLILRGRADNGTGER